VSFRRIFGSSSRRGRLAALAVTAFVLLLALDQVFDRIVPDSSIRQLAMLAGIYVMVAVSLNLVNGLAGQFSIGHAGFVGIGAYTSAIVASSLDAAGSPHAWLTIVAAVSAGAVLSAIAGLLVGLPSLRLRGDYLAVVTLGFAETFRLVIASADLAATSGVAGALARLGGQNGYAGVKGQGLPSLAGPFWVFGAAVLMTTAAYRIKRSGWGRALRALREDEIAAAAVGVDPTRYKVLAFVLSSVGAGAAGALWAIMRDGLGLVQPDQFGFQLSFDAITMVVLGGSGSVSGSVLGALVVTFTVKLIELLQGLDAVKALEEAAPWLDLNAVRMMIYAAVLISLMILRPEGLLGERELFERVRRSSGRPGDSRFAKVSSAA
jgi:branched-chain amino acid transport system permease protein